MSVIGAVVAEWSAATRAWARSSTSPTTTSKMDTAFAGVFTLALIGVGLFLITTVLEKRLLFWHESTWDVR